MSFVETEINGQIITIRLNRPERLNALSTVIRNGMECSSKLKKWQIF